MAMLSRKTFATNSLKYTFVWDVWFHGQIVYSSIEHLSNINEIITFAEKKNTTTTDGDSWANWENDAWDSLSK